MNKQLKMVRDFHTAFNYVQAPADCEELLHMSDKVRFARMSFINEEFAELLLERAKSSKVGQLDAVVDLAYFALGTLAIIGSEVLEPELAYAVPVSDQEEHPFLLLINCLGDLNLSLGFMEMVEEGDQDEAFLSVVQQLSNIYRCCMHYAEEQINCDFYGAFDEVQRSNMSKLGADGLPIYNEAGKIQKGEEYSPPELVPFVRA